MDRLDERWASRQRACQSEIEPITIQAATEIRATPEDLWDFLMSPLTGPLLDPDFVRSFAVPGTPEGVGQQWCTMSRADEGGLDVHVVEVIEIQPPHRLVVKLLTTPVSFLRMSSLAATSAGCAYSVRYGMQLPGGMARGAAASVQRALQGDIERVKAIVESGITWQTAGPHHRGQPPAGSLSEG
jgi:hypothetical protein